MSLAGVMVAAPAAEAAFPGRDGLIAFAQVKNFSSDIWVVGPKGRKGPDITRTRTFHESAPSFAPNGRTIAFYWTNRGGTTQGIGVVGSNGRGLRHLASGN